MTQLQKAVYILILRAIMVLLYHNERGTNPEEGEDSTLRRDLSETIMLIRNSIRKGKK